MSVPEDSTDLVPTEQPTWDDEINSVRLQFVTVFETGEILKYPDESVLFVGSGEGEYALTSSEQFVDERV